MANMVVEFVSDFFSGYRLYKKDKNPHTIPEDAPFHLPSSAKVLEGKPNPPKELPTPVKAERVKRDPKSRVDPITFQDIEENS